MTTGIDGAAAVEQYLDGLPEPQRSTLRALRAALLEVSPQAEEAIKYGMPALTVEGTAVAGYAGFADHCGYYPMSGGVIAAAGDAVAGYETSKGALKFPIDRPLPMALVRQLMTLRLAELAS